MTTETVPLTKRTHRLSLIWIVPILALIVGAYVVHREVMNRGPHITIDFSDGAGIAVGQTKVVHKGIVIGVVTGLNLMPDLSGVRVEVEMIPGAAAFAREGSRFWVNRPEISLRGVRGLETLLSGATISVAPGKGAPATAFVGLEARPINLLHEGTEYVLVTDHRSGIDVGTPVAYRGMPVGHVLDLQLTPDARSVRIRLQVDAPYDQLIRENTVFWNASGLDVSVGLFRGLRLRDGGVESMLQGSIAFATPDQPGNPVPPQHVFSLADKLDERWLRWSPAIHLGNGESVESIAQ